MTEEAVVPWQPEPFQGSDLLPTLAQAPSDEPLVGRENVSAEDLILPSLSLLQGQSKVCVERSVEGAKPGAFFMNTTQEVFKPPVRVILVHHHTSNALFPRASESDLQVCLSRDGITGTVYGQCEECRKCLDWREGNQPPLGAQSHNFVAMTDRGPAILRFSRTSFKAARLFLTSWTMSVKNLWTHPVVVAVKSAQKNLPGGQSSTYYSMDMVWKQNENVPSDIQKAAHALHDQIDQAYQAGKFQSEPTIDEDNVPL